MHEPIPEQGAWLKQVVRGFFAYHAVPTNGSALRAFYHYVKRIWLRTLRRRSKKAPFSWQGLPGPAATAPQPPKVGGGGGNSARPDLGGGGSTMTGPAALPGKYFAF